MTINNNHNRVIVINFKYIKLKKLLNAFEQVHWFLPIYIFFCLFHWHPQSCPPVPFLEKRFKSTTAKQRNARCIWKIWWSHRLDWLPVRCLIGLDWGNMGRSVQWLTLNYYRFLKWRICITTSIARAAIVCTKRCCMVGNMSQVFTANAVNNFWWNNKNLPHWINYKYNDTLTFSLQFC